MCDHDPTQGHKKEGGGTFLLPQKKENVCKCKKSGAFLGGRGKMRSEDGRFEASQLEILARPPLATQEKEVAHFVSMRRSRSKRVGKRAQYTRIIPPPLLTVANWIRESCCCYYWPFFFGLIRALPRSDRVVLQRPPLLGRPVVEGGGEGAKGQKTKKLSK